MNNTVLALIWILASYLIGSINFGIIISKLMRLPDPRRYGSNNPGATNVLRSGNKIAAVFTLLLDFFKGLLPLLLLKMLDLYISHVGWVLAGVGLAAFLGHVYPIFFNFKGGKGVATAAGVLFAIHWLLGLLLMVTWLLVVAVSKISSLAAIVTALLAPIYYFLGVGFFGRYHETVLLSTCIMSAILIVRHHANIARLIKGTEPKIGREKPALSSVTVKPQAHKYRHLKTKNKHKH